MLVRVPQPSLTCVERLDRCMLQAYEHTISNWTSFRPTFARLSVNVTAYFGVAPVNTTDPGLDTDPPPPGVAISLKKSEEPDPIHDEEGDAGGLPEYVPLKYREPFRGRACRCR